jgi:hypothetical protein
MRPARDTEDAVRDAMHRLAEDMPYVPDLRGKMNRRAARIRGRRRVLAAAVSALAVVAVAGVAAWLPARGVPDVPVANPPATSPTSPAGRTTTPPSGSPKPGPDTSQPSTSGRIGPASPTGSTGAAPGWGPLLLDEGFAAPALDTGRWDLYAGASDSPETVWAPEAAGQSAGMLRLSVERVRATTPVARAGGVRLRTAPQRYGRWEVRWRMSAGYGVSGQFVLFGAGPGGIDLLATLRSAERTLTVADLARGNSRDVAVDGTRFHTLTVESTPRGVRWLLDGAVLADHAGAVPVPLGVGIQALIPAQDCGRLPLPAGCAGRASFPQRLDVDYLRFWAYRA